MYLVSLEESLVSLVPRGVWRPLSRKVSDAEVSDLDGGPGTGATSKVAGSGGATWSFGAMPPSVVNPQCTPAMTSVR